MLHTVFEGWDGSSPDVLPHACNCPLSLEFCEVMPAASWQIRCEAQICCHRSAQFFIVWLGESSNFDQSFGSPCSTFAPSFRFTPAVTCREYDLLPSLPLSLPPRHHHLSRLLPPSLTPPPASPSLVPPSFPPSHKSSTLHA